MARAALEWNAQQLANSAKIGVATVNRFERAGSVPSKATVDAIRTALESAGVEFIAENGGGAGVRLRKSYDKFIYQDAEGLEVFPREDD